MKTNMKKGAATRAKIVEEAGRLASVRGLGAVSLNDLAEAVGLSKSGVFKHFDDKEALHLAVLEAAIERFLALVWTPALKVPAGRERLTFIFDRWLDWVETEGGPGGCPFQQASIEFDDQPGKVRDFLRDMHLRWGKTLAGEMASLCNPPLPADRCAQAVFDMKSYIKGFVEQRRLLDDARARSMPSAAFGSLLDRLTCEPAAA
jgi:AcrR family transcriptional regulator